MAALGARATAARTTTPSAPRSRRSIARRSPSPQRRMNRALDAGLRGQDVAAVEAKVDRDRTQDGLARARRRGLARRPQAQDEDDMPKVRFEPDGIEIEVPVGTTHPRGVEQGARARSARPAAACAPARRATSTSSRASPRWPQERREEDIMDKAFDVRANSRLGCQSKILRDATVVVEISRESRQAFLDEHPEIRAALKQAGGLPPR